ncbi:MAG: DUF2786 domain-containing protein [Haloechinothrix sp.]
MGKRNREKRAAKKRNRLRHGPTAPRGDYFGFQEDSGGDGFTDQFRSEQLPPPAEALAETLIAAAHRHFAGDASAAPACAAERSRGQFGHQAQTVGSAAGIALAKVLDRVWQSGWLPVDVWEVARRCAGEDAASLVIDTIAADTARHASATVHERWGAQVRQLDAVVWWDRDRPQLGQWAQRQAMSLEQAITVVITLLAELMTLPELPQILPPPGTATRHATASAAGVDQKILTRVRSLLAKAESTQFPDEAEALSAKAQELMNRHAFERALLDADAHKPQLATSSRLWLDNPYLDAKSHLVAEIARANRCRTVFYKQFGFVALVGEELDLEITELLATSLLVQATRAMLAEGRHTTRTGVSRTQSFRRSFLVSYAVQVGERLKEAGAAAHDRSDDARLLPVLADRSRAVEDTFQAMFSHTVQKSVTISNGAGWHAGRVAADRADLKINRSALSA